MSDDVIETGIICATLVVAILAVATTIIFCGLFSLPVLIVIVIALIVVAGTGAAFRDSDEVLVGDFF